MDQSTYGVFLVILISSSSIFSNASRVNSAFFDVTRYGARGRDNSDDSQAFLKAWNDACASSRVSTVYVPPNGKFLINPITFLGPCKAPAINFVIKGTIMAPASPRSWQGIDPGQWLVFKNIKGLHFYGNGLVDGQGKAWWDQSCRYHPQLRTCTRRAPTAWTFLSCSDSSINNIRFINSAQTHIMLGGCTNFVIQYVSVNSPGDSPNTDGIHLGYSQNVIIKHVNLSCGDDCISIGDHVSELHIEDIQCGPGHGISIGSLGGSNVDVKNINVTGASFTGTTNGARIKTWEAGRGYVRNLTFENLSFNDVQNPIVIDQHYCSTGCKAQAGPRGVEISNVTYKQARGTSATNVAINLNCTMFAPCYGIYMENINIKPSKRAGGRVSASCSYAYGREDNVVPANPCLRK